MRFPFSQLYRAFPELDRFSDAECTRYEAYARQRIGQRLAWGPIVIGLGMTVWGFIILGMVMSAMGSRGWSPRLDRPAGMIGILTVLIVGPLCGFVIRDIHLKAVIRERLRTARCPRCDFSLLGLPVFEGAVVCPECGTEIVLSQHHLRAEDLLVKPDDSARAAKGESGN